MKKGAWGSKTSSFHKRVCLLTGLLLGKSQVFKEVLRKDIEKVVKKTTPSFEKIERLMFLRSCLFKNTLSDKEFFRRLVSASCVHQTTKVRKILLFEQRLLK